MAPARFPVPIPVKFRPSSVRAASLAVAVVTLLTLVPGWTGASPAAVPVASVPHEATSTVPLAAPATGTPGHATHWSHVVGAAPSTPGAFTATPGLNFSAFCDPYHTPIGGAETGVNFSVNTTPASGSGVAPVNFSWSATVHSGGLPPYAFNMTVGVDAKYPFPTNLSWYPTNSSGNLTLTHPGIYFVTMRYMDSSCEEYSEIYFQLAVISPTPPPGIAIVPSVTRGTVPLQVNYSVTNGSSLPANWSYMWVRPYPPVYGGPWAAPNYTYFYPGTYSAEIDVFEPNDQLYEVVDSPNVTLNGSAPFTTAVTVTPGPYPVNVTLWVNRTNASLALLPLNETYLYLYVYNGTTGTAVSTLSTSSPDANITATGVGCGQRYRLMISSPGVCALTFSTIVDGNNASMVDRSILGFDEFVYNLTATPPVSSWAPTFTASVGPVNSTSVPTVLHINISAANGSGSFFGMWSIYGRTSGPNGTFLPTQWGSVGVFNNTTWNGSRVAYTANLTRGYYFVMGLLGQNGIWYPYTWFPFAAPLVIVGSHVVVGAPVQIRTTESPAASPGPNGTLVTFRAVVASGVGPFTVQWAFGDGTYAASQPNATVQHLYTTAGTYDPTVTVTAADGESATSDLGALAISSPTSSPTDGRTGSSGPPAPNAPLPREPGVRHVVPIESTPPASRAAGWTVAVGPLAAALGVAVVLILAGGLLHRREVRRQGEDLVAPWASEDDPAGRRAPEDRA